MNISVTILCITAPISGVPKRRQKCHAVDYRKAYCAVVKARQLQHGPLDRKVKGNLLGRIAIRSQTEVAAILGVSKEAVRQVENRALAKLRTALRSLYGELSH